MWLPLVFLAPSFSLVSRAGGGGYREGEVQGWGIRTLGSCCFHLPLWIKKNLMMVQCWKGPQGHMVPFPHFTDEEQAQGTVGGFLREVVLGLGH